MTKFKGIALQDQETGKFQKYRPVVVEFDDISSYDRGWKRPQEVDGFTPLRCWAAGHLLENSKKWVKVASMIAENGALSDVLVIPKGALVKIWRLT